MNKIILTSLIIVGSMTSIFSQSPSKWAINGNSVGSNEFIGTTNNEPFILKSNNIVGLKLKTDGSLIIKSLDLNSGAPNGLVITNGQGEISRLNFNGNSNSILLGDGTWGTLPSFNNTWQMGNNSKIYYTAGKVGIGTTTPNFDLDVQGNARITNTLIVNGQLIISDKIQTSRQLKSMRVESDSIMMDSTRALYGKTIIRGDVQAKYNLGVDGNIATNGSLLAKQGVLFDGAKGIRLLPATANNPQTFLYGGVLQPLSTYCAAGPQAWANHQFGGMLQIYDYNNPTTSGLLNLQTWTGGSSIDASTGGETTGGLLLNYFCHSPTYINTGWDIPNGVDGGRVYMGAEVEMQRSLKIGWNGNPSIVDANTSLEINQNTNNSNAIKVKTFASNMKAFSIEYTDASNGFVVWGDGRTDIFAKSKTNKYFVVNDVSVPNAPVEALSIQGNGYTQYNVSNPTAMPNVIDVFDNTVTTNAKYLFRVSSKGHVYAREVEILNTTLGFPDYVFAKEYKLMPLAEVEKYIDSNKHLPGFEKGEVYDQNGIKTSELIYKQQEKIEELTLYIIELEKRMKAIEVSIKH